MRKRYTSTENEMIFNVVYGMIKDSEYLQEACRKGNLNNTTEPVINELRKHIKNRSDEALAIQMSLVACAVFFPDRIWANHSRGVKYRQMFENLIRTK